MNRDEIIDLLKKSKTKEAKLRLKEIEKQKKEIQLNELKKEYKINITPVFSEGGKGNAVNSKVESAVVNKYSDIEELEKEIKELKKEIEILSLEVEETNVRLGTLSYMEKEILTDYFVNGMSYEDIGNFTYYKIRQQTRGVKAIKRIIDRALDKLLEI